MKAYRFRIPLTKPLPLKGETHVVREGVLLERNGRWSEASPLPGFSEESIEDVIAALRGEKSNPPSLRFALLALETPIESQLSVPWNYLLIGNREEVFAGVETCKQSKCRAAKLKVGRGELEPDIELVREVRERLSADVQLRLDANQAWTLDQAISFAKSTADIDLEYIEEPLRDPHQLEELYSETGLKYALDETLLQENRLDAWPNATALICKPTILGGKEAVERLAATGKPVVFSAAFESGVGIARIVQLAAEYSPQIAAGLDTLDWLTDDLLQESPQKKDGMFCVSGKPIANVMELESITL